MKTEFTLVNRGTSPELSDKLARCSSGQEALIHGEKKYVIAINGSGNDGIGDLDSQRVLCSFADDPRVESVALGVQREPLSVKKLQEYIELLQECTSPNDEFYFFITGHGDYAGENSFLKLGEQTFSPQEFAQLVSPLRKINGFLYFSNCYGRHFAEETGKGKWIGIAASNSQEECFAIEGEGTLFTTYFLETIANARRKGRHLTLEDAFDVATNRTARHLRKYTSPITKPQLYWQDNDPATFALV